MGKRKRKAPPMPWALMDARQKLRQRRTMAKTIARAIAYMRSKGLDDQEIIEDMVSYPPFAEQLAILSEKLKEPTCP